MGHAMKTTKLTEYLKTAEAAEFLGVSQNTLRKWAAQGSMPMQRKAFNGKKACHPPTCVGFAFC
jgi:excisionase family DNA binding protein